MAGFDTGAEGLQDAADGVAQWMRVTRRAVDGIRFLEPATGKVFSANLREAKDARKALDDWKNNGATGKLQGVGRSGMGLLIEPRAVGERDGLSVSCHKNIDPVGFAFQNFDISGRWRDVEFESYACSELDGRIAWRARHPSRNYAFR